MADNLSPADQLAASIAQIRAANQDSPTLDTMTISAQRGNSLTADNVLINDWQSLTPIDFYNKYGEQTYNDMAAFQIGGRRVRSVEYQDRTPGEITKDSLIGIGSGVAQGVGGLATLGAGLVSDKAGVAAARAMGQAKEFTNSLQSDTLNRHRAVDAIRNALDQQDSRKAFEEDKAKDGELMATLRSAGRGVLKGAKRLGEDPMMLTDMVAEAGGSMLVGGPASKVITKGASLLGSRAIAAAAEKLAFPATVGAMEAGGAYQATAQDIMAMSHEELAANSPEYQKLLGQGVSPEDAKVELAGQASLLAAGITFPIAAVSGKLVEGLEKAPIKALRTSPGRAVTNMGKEFTEESIQSGTGQFAQNVGEKTTVNPNQDLGEGVGDQAIQGGIAGFASAGVHQAPGAALSATATAARATGQAALNALTNRASEARNEAERSSSVSDENVQANVTTAVQAAPEVKTTLDALAQEAVTQAPAERKDAVQNEANDYINKVTSAAALTPELLAKLPAGIQKILVDENGAPQGDRFSMLKTMAQIAGSEEASPKLRIAAGLSILAGTQDLDKLFSEAPPEFLKNIDHNRPEYKMLQDYQDLVKTIQQNPAIADAIQVAQQKLEITPEQVKTPDQDMADNAVKMAEIIPEKMNPEVADVILQHAKDGKVTLSEMQQKLLKTASALNRAGIEGAIALSGSTPENTNDNIIKQKAIDIVRNHVEEGGGRGKSLKQHFDAVMGAILRGDDREAKRNAILLNRFAQSRVNKVAALNQAIQDGKGTHIPYRSVDVDGRWLPEDGRQHVYFRKSNANSEKLARQVYSEAKSITTLANAFAKLYPGFGINEIAVPELNLGTINQGIASQSQRSADRGASTTGRSSDSAQSATTQTTGQVEDRQQKEAPLSPQPASPQASQESQAKAEPVVTDQNAETNAPNQKVQAKAEETPKPVRGPESTVQGADAAVSVAEGAPEAVKASASQAETAGETQPAKSPEGSTQGTTEQTTEEAFPELVRSHGQNFFHKGFKLPGFGKEISRLISQLNPLVWIQKVMANPDEVDGYLGAEFTDDMAEGYQVLMGKAREAFKEMNRRLREPKVQKLLQGLDETRKDNGEPIIPLKYTRGRALNLIENENGKLGYNNQLAQAGMAAALDWVLNVTNSESRIDPEELAQNLGLSQVPQDLVALFSTGLDMGQAKKALASRILDFWGLQKNGDAPIEYNQGILEGFAAELLAGLEATGFLTKETHDEFLHLTGREYTRIYFNTGNKQIKSIFGKIKGAKKLLAQIALTEDPFKGISIGQPINSKPKTQLRNPGVNLTRQQNKAVEHEEQVPYLPNQMMFDLLSSVDEKEFLVAMGGQTNLEGLNVNHRKSVEGKNRGIIDAYNAIMQIMDEVKYHADNKGKSLSEIPLFFQHEITRVGRLQMVGLVTPQGDKIAREVFMPTRSTLDMTTAQHQDFFWLTVAQGLGIKTEQKSRAEAVADAQNLVVTRFKNVLAELEAWEKNRQAGVVEKLPKGLLERITRANGKPISMHGLHSLMAVANLNVTKDNGGDISKYTHYNYLEADGKTNGPINALMLLTTGEFTPSWLKAVGKGGAFFGWFGQQGKALNAHEDKVDLYKAGSLRAETLLGAKRAQAQAQNKQAAEHMDALFTMFNKLMDGKITFQGDQIEIDRGLTKNPLTISIYGSGTTGIATKVASELLDLIYEKMSEFNQAYADGTAKKLDDVTYPGFERDFNNLIQNKVVFSQTKNKWFLLKNQGGPAIGTIDTDRFTIQPKQFEAFRDNVKSMFVDHLREAINDTVMGHVSKTTGAIQKATQIQSIAMRALFRRAIIEKLYEKRKAGNQEFLSDNELNAILKKLKGYGPQFSTGTQSYFLAGREQGDILGETRDEKGKILKKIDIDGVEVKVPDSLAKGVLDDFDSNFQTYAPGLAGVKAIPSVVIGSGDGQMMLNAATNAKIERVLKVFDGMNMAADQIENYSREINRHVHETWTTNPVRAILESFEKFIALDPFTQLDENNPFNNIYTVKNEAWKEMAKVISGDPNATTTELNAIQDQLSKTLADLKFAADSIDARQAVYKKFPMSVDQMASGETPYVQVGTISIVGDQTEANILKAMNDEYRRQMTSKGYTPAAEAPPVTKADAKPKLNVDLLEAVFKNGKRDADSGAVVLHRNALSSMLFDISESLPENQRDVFQSALQGLIGKGYQAIFGDRDELDTWLQNNNGDRYQGNELDNSWGFVDPVSKLIVISNAATETTVHELIHASTFQKVGTYFSNPESLAQEERDAVKRIDGLMEEWLAQDFSSEDGLAQTSREMALATIQGWLQKGNRAAAVNEFMAWVLANQSLARVAAKTETNPILRIAAQALEAIKKLIWGSRADQVTVDNSLLSQLRFNTQILMELPSQSDKLKADSEQVTLFQSPSFGSSDYLSDLREQFHERVVSWILDSDQAQVQLTREVNVQDATTKALAMTNVFSQHGFLQTMQEQSTFEAIVTALMTDADLNPHTLSSIQEIYSHVIQNLKWEDFKDNQDMNDLNDNAQALDKYNALQGVFGTREDLQGRSSLLPTFLALSLVNEPFRSVLAKMKTPALVRQGNTLDAHLSNLGSEAMDRLGRALSGDQTDKSVLERLDALKGQLIANVADQRSFIEQGTNTGLDKADKFIADNIQKLSSKIVDKADDVYRNTNSKLLRFGANVVSVAGGLVNEKVAERLALSLTEQLNQNDRRRTIREFINEAIGRTKENASVFDMISKVRSTVQQVRQQFREETPKEIAKLFTRKMEAKHWTALHHWARTDFAALKTAHGISGSLDLITDTKKLNREINNLENQIRTLARSRSAMVLRKSQQLAHYLNTGEHGVNLLRNAHAVAYLYGESHRARPGQADNLVDPVDQLVTLYAFRDLAPETKSILTDLAQNERKGLEDTLAYLVGLRATEHDKINNDIIRINQYKGYVPSEQKQGVSLIVANDSETARLTLRGYKRVAPYKGSSADRGMHKKSYFYAPVSGRAAYSQGVMQTVHQTVNGIDPRTGFTLDLTAGRITDPAVIQAVRSQISNQQQTRENLLPVYNEHGQMVALERGVDVTQLAPLQKSTDLARMIGAWKGRQMEEELAQEVNRVLVENLHDTWQEGQQKGRTREFVNLAQSTDPVLQEAWNLIPYDTKEQIEHLFGSDSFMVRRDMLNDAVGFRMASMTDVFTGKTRWSPEIQKRIQDLALGVFKGKAYTKLVQGEQFAQDLVVNAKVLIVVKSAVVPAANLMANIYQMMNRGVPFQNIIRGMAKKTAELNFYIKQRHREIELDTQLQAARGANDDVRIRKIENELKTINDANKRLKIWPLIEAGEFSSISAGGVHAEDLALAEGRWGDWAERLAQKVPAEIRTPLRYGLITRDTALFQGLARAVQYGDFLGKAILFDDLTARQGKSREEALIQISEEFINYNRLSGRTGDYLESIGLRWFWRFKIRSMKVAANMLRHNPVRSLLMLGLAPSSLPMIGSIGLPATDNFLSVLGDGRLGYSIGPSMGLNAFHLNPWMNIIN